MPPENSKNQEGNQSSVPTSELKQIRTFQGDVASALSGQKESIFSIHQSEVTRKRSLGTEESTDEKSDEQKRKDFLFLSLGSALLIILGTLGAWYGYREIIKRNTPPVLSVPQNRFISATSEVELGLTGLNRESFALGFSEALTENPREALRHVIGKIGIGETERIITTEEFFTLIESRAPGSLVRALNPLFMIGAVGESRFMILRLDSYENAFAGMLAWEKTMAEDLIPIFGNAEDLKVIAPESVFNDVIVRNKDVRVLLMPASETGEERPVLLYSFFDNSALIITDKIETLQVLIERLSRERLSR